MKKLTFTISVPTFSLPSFEAVTTAIESVSESIDTTRDYTAKQLHRVADAIQPTKPGE